ncbi:MAG: alpha/beta hydrolase domain-containing protein [Bryobacteraceae bacterium]
MLRRLWILPLLAAVSQAALVRIEVESRSDVLGGRAFGSTGPYERIVGKAYFAVDPKLEANRIIADVDLAPKNADGLVEFHSDIYVLKPRDPSKGNGSVLYEVSNRGNKGMLSMFNKASSSLDPAADAHFGDGFLMEKGYTLVWLGWQFDPPRIEGRMRLYTPSLKGIQGLVRSEFVPNSKVALFSLADRDHIPYLPANPDDPKLALTVRDRAEGPRRTIPRGEWKIEDDRVAMSVGFEPGKLYEVVYTARDPALVGLGPTAVRDLISFLKYGMKANVTVLADHKRFIKRAYGFGVSQSGRFLRTFLYYGFNQDEEKRKVFDGMMVHVAGGGRGSFNHRFAQPSRDGHPFMNTFYPTDIFPYTDVAQSDPETGITDGLLERAMKAGVAPKIFYTNSSYEYWGRAASLIHTTIDGKQDAPLPDSTRVYHFAGSQHGPAGFPPSRTTTQNLTNSNPFTWSMRALLVAMDRWTAEGKEPPPSRHPKISEDNLVAPGAVQFPKIPGIRFPERMQKGYRVDYGAEFRTKGIVSIEPPRVGNSFPTFVPQVDRDGNEITGIRLPEIQTPLATYTGWNLRAPELGATDELFSMAGSFLPFARTKAERQRNKDPRPSIEERYASREEYLRATEAAARSLAAEGYLLEQDVPKMVERGSQLWDHLHAAR